MDKDKLFYILNDWNFWDKPVPGYFSRTDYQEKISKYSATGEVVIFQGIRRAGKSTLMTNYISNLFSTGISAKSILMVNLEDPRFETDLTTDLLEQIFQVYREYINHDDRCYIFLDEVQNVEKWEKWVHMGYELKRGQFYITGSSSKLLSREFGTALGGRYLGIHVFPLSFQEFCRFRGLPEPDRANMITQQLIFKKTFQEYLQEGGFPKVASLDPAVKRPEILMYYETIILKDIVARHGLKNFENITRTAQFLLTNIGKQTNLNRIRLNAGISHELAEKYYEYIKDTYLLFEVLPYHDSLSKQFSSNRKVYCIDNSFLNYTSFRFSEDKGRYLENLVCIDLIRRGKEVFFHQGKKECDFLVRDGIHITECIQVCYSMTNEVTRKREVDGLLEAMEAHGIREGLILTEDEEDTLQINSVRIKILPAWKWLLEG
ncbi:MAG TPA: ATP-binding protein [Bacteroidales bacterium]|nr:ATP-binding protein [Bacteroidales bacterium]HRZ49587.1 ATP-binding protein [Bacteroidales bacterium]